MCRPHPAGVILRATKVLAHVSFDADVYQQLFPDAESVFNYLRQRHVQLVVLDTFPHRLNFPHNALLRQLVSQPGRFSLTCYFPERFVPRFRASADLPPSIHQLATISARPSVTGTRRDLCLECVPYD